jgi:hypothetical protein
VTDLFTTTIPEKPLKKDQTIIDPYMTPPEFCRAFKASAYAIKVAMDTGKIESFLINGRVKVRTEEAVKYLEERSTKRRAS